MSFLLSDMYLHSINLIFIHLFKKILYEIIDKYTDWDGSSKTTDSLGEESKRNFILLTKLKCEEKLNIK